MATNYEQNVRDAAEALRAAVEEAEANGYRVSLPGRASDLGAIAISETGARNAPLPAGEEYDRLSKAALLELATARGLDPAANATKAELATLLRSGRPAASPAVAGPLTTPVP